MAEPREARPAAAWSGLLLVDKPAGVTSHDVVDRVRRRLLAKQAGFRDVETRFLNPPAGADEPPELDLRVREILFAPLDYAILART